VLLSVPNPPRVTIDGRCFHARAYDGTTDSGRGRAPGTAATVVFVIVIIGAPPSRVKSWRMTGW
jgi:hypothetical protein